MEQLSSSPRRPTALITGAAKRLGRAIAGDLAAHGYNIALHANSSADEAHRLGEELRAAYGIDTAVVAVDLADADAVREIVPAAVDALGGLNILVNNASLFIADGIGDLASPLWRRQMAVNAEAPAMLADAFARHCGRGLVVNIIDQRVWKPTPRHVSYSASKATLWWLTQTLAQALAPDIRVVGLGPGPTIKGANQTDQDFQTALDTVPLRRGAEPADFGAAIRFLVSQPSITGQMIALDGGQHLAWETPDALVNE